MGRENSLGKAAWRPIVNTPNAGSQTRGRPLPTAPRVKVSSNPPNVTRLGDVSRFSILEHCSREEDILNSLEALKRKIQTLPEPSNLFGLAHEKQNNKAAKGKGGPRADSIPQGASTKEKPHMPDKSQIQAHNSIPTNLRAEAGPPLQHDPSRKSPLHGETGQPVHHPQQHLLGNAMEPVADKPPNNLHGEMEVDGTTEDSSLKRNEEGTAICVVQDAGRAAGLDMEVS